MTKRLSPDPDLDGLIKKLNRAARSDEEEELEAASESAPPGGSESAPEGAATTPRPIAARWSIPRPGDESRERLGDLLGRARKSHASDLLLVAGSPAVIRVNGKLRALGESPLTPGAVASLCGVLLPAPRREQAAATGSTDFALTHESSGRIRCNVHRQGGGWAAAIRLLPASAPGLDSLNLPEQLLRFTELEHGLVLVTGPTGSGKSTTLAALIRNILSKRSVHLITVEDPVEYEHGHAGSVVEHIEVGRDIPAYDMAVRSMMRQDPDVMLIGEMRDPDSMSVAITAGETGHLVFSTLHTGDAPQSVHRILDCYPAEQTEMIRAQLAASLAGVVSQQLLPRADGKGRVPAVEILVATPAVRNLIRQGKTEQLRSQLTLERNAGMLDLDRSLAGLVRNKLVDLDEARSRARTPDMLDILLRGS